MGTVLFFDAEDADSRGALESQAKAVCSNCQVRLKCLEHALGKNEKHGIWGGMTSKERAAFKRRASRARNSDRTLTTELTS